MLPPPPQPSTPTSLKSKHHHHHAALCSQPPTLRCAASTPRLSHTPAAPRVAPAGPPSGFSRTRAAATLQPIGAGRRPAARPWASRSPGVSHPEPQSSALPAHPHCLGTCSGVGRSPETAVSTGSTGHMISLHMISLGRCDGCPARRPLSHTSRPGSRQAVKPQRSAWQPQPFHQPAAPLCMQEKQWSCPSTTLPPSLPIFAGAQCLPLLRTLVCPLLRRRHNASLPKTHPLKTHIRLRLGS